MKILLAVILALAMWVLCSCWQENTPGVITPMPIGQPGISIDG